MDKKYTMKYILLLSMIICNTCYGQQTVVLDFGDAPIDHIKDTVTAQLLVADTSGKTSVINGFCIRLTRISRRGRHTTGGGDGIYFNDSDVYSYETLGYLGKDKKPIPPYLTVWQAKKDYTTTEEYVNQLFKQHQ